MTVITLSPVASQRALENKEGLMMRRKRMMMNVDDFGENLNRVA